MWRITAVFAVITACFGLILLRLFYWQVIAGPSLRIQAADQYFLEFSLPPARGQIMASDGSPLAMNAPAYLLFAEPKMIEDSRMFAAAVAPEVGVDEVLLEQSISKEGAVWVPIAHKVDNEIAETLRKLNVKGLGFEPDPKRYYPEASMAAHLLGFVGSDSNGSDRGYFGLEGYYDRQLRGVPGQIRIEKDVRGAPIVIGDERRIPAENGRSLTLWIDRSIQKIAEERLLDGIEKYGAKEGSVVIMDPNTGGVLAMSSYPSYDPREFSKFDRSLYVNPAVGQSYEPGSTFKVLVMAAGLSEGVVDTKTTFNEDGPVTVGEYAIRTWDNTYRGLQTMAEVIQHSSNVGMVFVGEKLGRDKLISYIKNFGFGQLTDIDLEDEQSPQLRPDNEWKDIDAATATFGQGIAVTPIQMVRAVSAIANGGFLYTPQMVRTIIDSRGKQISVDPARKKRVISTKAAEIMTEMMINAVDNGEAKWAKPKGYRIAGKTGTAQIPVAGHYDEKKTIASFVGFAPADNPQFVMLVTLREPSTSKWGSETAAPLFFSIAQDIFRYKNIPPQ